MKSRSDGKQLSDRWVWRLNDELGGTEDGAWRLASPGGADGRSNQVEGLEDGASRLVRRKGRPGPTSVFVAEDDRDLRKLIADTLRKDGYLVVESENGSALMIDLAGTFLQGSETTTDVVVISDLRMPGTDGLSVLRALRRHSWSPPFILMTAFGDPSVHDEARRLGAAAVIDKPIDLWTIRWAVRLLAATPS